MARKKRFIRAGFCYHVLLRGNAGQDIFLDNVDRARFCLLIQYASEKHKLICHGFCLMNNHVHLLIQPLTEDLSSGIHSLTFRYAQYFNRKYDRKGYLYQGRFKAIIVQSGDYLRRLIRYIHLNPVRANIVKCAENYPWSSHLAYAEKASYVWLCKNLILDSFGDSTEKLFHYINKTSDGAIDDLLEIRKSYRYGVYGDEEFLEDIRAELTEDESLDNLSVQKKSISLEEVIKAVCCHMDVSINTLQTDSRNRQLIKARTVLAILVKKLRIANFSSLGHKIGRDPTSLAKLAKKMESDPSLLSITNELSIKLTRA